MGDTPTASAPDPSTSSPSEWHTIRPWTPHLTLAVREITSVSATFILSSSLDTRHASDDGSGPELNGDTSDETTYDTVLDSRGIIADAISHGLSVDVNGSNWQRVILRMNEHADEAIIVIYGLHPGRQYDIDLALVSGGTMRKQVTTEDAESSPPDNERAEDHHHFTMQETLSASVITANEGSPSVPSTSLTPTPEDRLRTLSHQLSALHNEQANLQSALKSSRRDANKTTTSLRTEIDILKRASEKAGTAEFKARQRVRALEDAVRRANEGREELEHLMGVDEQELPGLTEKQTKAEGVLSEVKKEADAVRAEREKQEADGRKRKESVKGECASLNQRLERLTVKKERLENSVIPDLEAQLAEIQREIELAGRGSLQNGDLWDSLYGDPSRTGQHVQRRRLSYPGTIGRPPAQRASQPPISPPHFSRHQPRSQSYRTSNDSVSGLPHPPGLSGSSGLLHSSSSSMPPSGSSVFIPATPSLSHSTNTIFSTPSTSSSLSRSTSSVSSSTLSSKAPPFEPNRNLLVSLSSPSSSGALPPGGLLSMSSQGFSPSSTTFSSSSTSGYSFSGSYTSTQRLSQTAQKDHDTDLGSNQVRLGWPSTSRGSAEDGWPASNN